MSQDKKEIIGVRTISTAFIVFALTIFKPFGLAAWQWQMYVHVLAFFLIGFSCCLVTEGTLKYIVKKPRSTKRGVSYIIRRNLWFQILNTPLVALILSLYRHFVLNERVEGNQLSWGNFLETLLIIGFCSFAIGMFWRFKFRSRYLMAELEETRLLNEQLQKMQQEQSKEEEALEEKAEQGETPAAALPATITLTGTTNETVTLAIAHLLYIETVGNYVKVYYLRDGQVRNDMLRATSKQMEIDLQDYPMIVRCHRAFLVNLGQVEQIVSKTGSMQLVIKHSHEAIPVSRSNMAQVKEAIKEV